MSSEEFVTVVATIPKELYHAIMSYRHEEVCEICGEDVAVGVSALKFNDPNKEIITDSWFDCILYESLQDKLDYWDSMKRGVGNDRTVAVFAKAGDDEDPALILAEEDDLWGALLEVDKECCGDCNNCSIEDECYGYEEDED